VDYRYPERVSMRSYNPTVKGHPRQIKKAVDLLLSAKRPMIYTGGGVVLSDGSQELVEFVRRLGYPITSTLMGLGAYPGSDPQFLGMLGMHGTYEANMAMHECDVLIAIGARFDDRVTGNIEHFCPTAKIIHIDIDPASISKNVQVDVPIVGSVPTVLADMNRLLEKSGRKPDQAALAKWWEQIEQCSTRCGRPSTTSSTSHAGGSTPAGWGPWASACLPPWGCSSPTRAPPWPASPARAASR